MRSEKTPIRLCGWLWLDWNGIENLLHFLVIRNYWMHTKLLNRVLLEKLLAGPGSVGFATTHDKPTIRHVLPTKPIKLSLLWSVFDIVSYFLRIFQIICILCRIMHLLRSSMYLKGFGEVQGSSNGWIDTRFLNLYVFPTLCLIA